MVFEDFDHPNMNEIKEELIFLRDNLSLSEIDKTVVC